eukprot:6533633-Prymnesium_polylepis.1
MADPADQADQAVVLPPVTKVCCVRAKGCRGNEAEPHPTWRWKRAKKAGELKRESKDVGGEETSWAAEMD